MALQIYPNTTNTAFYFTDTDSGVENVYTRGELAVTYDSESDRYFFRSKNKPYAGVRGMKGYALSEIQNESGGAYTSKAALFSYLDSFFFKPADALPPIPIVIADGRYECPGGLYQGSELADGTVVSNATFSFPQTSTKNYVSSIFILEGVDLNLEGAAERVILATLSGTLASDFSGTLPALRVYGQLPVDGAESPQLVSTATPNDITSRVKTSAYAVIPNPLPSSTSAGNNVNFASVAAILEEIVSNEYYEKGNVAFIIELDAPGSHNGSFLSIDANSLEVSLQTESDSNVVWTERGANNASAIPSKLGSLLKGETHLIYNNKPVAKVGSNFSIEGERGFVLPRLTTAQRDALAAMAGMVVYNTNTNTVQYYNGTSWVAM